MARYKLLYGRHSDETRNYAAGDIVESNQDLTQLKNGDNPRFELVPEPVPYVPAEISTPEVPVQVVTPEPEVADETDHADSV